MTGTSCLLGLVAGPGPARDLTQRVEVGIRRGVRVLHGHAAAELDVFAHGGSEVGLSGDADLVEGPKVEVDEALALRFADL